MYSKEELIEFFKEDFFATKLLGAEILDVKDGYAKCVFNPNENHKNAKGVTMGGAIFTLADFTFAVATNQSEDFYTVEFEYIDKDGEIDTDIAFLKKEEFLIIA